MIESDKNNNYIVIVNQSKSIFEGYLQQLDWTVI